MAEKPHPVQTLLEAEVRVVNVGLASFAEELRARSVPVVHVDWEPPRPKDPRLTSLLDKLGT